MHHAQHQKDPIPLDYVVHHAVVTDAKAMEGVGHPPDRLHLLSADPSQLGELGCQIDQRVTDSGPLSGPEVRVCAFCGGGESDIEPTQSRSSRRVVRPF